MVIGKKNINKQKKVAETKVKSAQPTTRFYFLTFKKKLPTITPRSNNRGCIFSECQKVQTGVHRSEIQ